MSTTEDKKAEKKRLAEEAKLLKAQEAAAKKEAKLKAALEKKEAKERAVLEKKQAKESAKKAKRGSAPASPMSSHDNSNNCLQVPHPAPTSISAPPSPAVTKRFSQSTIPIENAPRIESLTLSSAAASPSAASAPPVRTSPPPTQPSTDACAPAPTIITPSQDSATAPSDEPSALQPRANSVTMRVRRSSSATLSILGAPTQRPPSIHESGMQSKPEENTTVVEMNVVEDDIDEQVGEMTQSDAVANAEYLESAINSLKERMRVLHAGGTNAGYSEAYQAMGTIGRDQPALASFREANRLKNREYLADSPSYANIVAYDHSRVMLPVINDDPDTDYVNANYIDGYKKKNTYIASQGPVPNSFISFWRMIWHTKADTIVMVTHEVENGRMKCHRYWPDPTSSPPNARQDYGDIIVTHLLSEPHKHYILRQFEVEHNGEKRKLNHFACLSWPDHGVPLTTSELLGFRNAVKKSMTNADTPIVIHCSAGVGRTGTYIAIDNLVEQCMDRGGPLDVDAVIVKLRMARNHMVQTEVGAALPCDPEADSADATAAVVQYMFIYRAVLDAISELLTGESRKAEAVAHAEAAQRAAEEKSKADAIESAAIEEARRELVARNEYSAASAAMIINLSIKDRLQKLQDAQSHWMENYKRSLEEWSLRNQSEAEVYDLTSTLTPVQSRLEALRQKGLLG